MLATVLMTILARLKPAGVTKLNNRSVNVHGTVELGQVTESLPKFPLGPDIVINSAALALEANNDAATTTDEQNNFLRIETSSVYGSSLAIVTGAIVNNTLVACDEPSYSPTFGGRSEVFYAIGIATVEVEKM